MKTYIEELSTKPQYLPGADFLFEERENFSNGVSKIINESDVYGEFQESLLEGFNFISKYIRLSECNKDNVELLFVKIMNELNTIFDYNFDDRNLIIKNLLKSISKEKIKNSSLFENIKNNLGLVYTDGQVENNGGIQNEIYKVRMGNDDEKINKAIGKFYYDLLNEIYNELKELDKE